MNKLFISIFSFILLSASVLYAEESIAQIKEAFPFSIKEIDSSSSLYSAKNKPIDNSQRITLTKDGHLQADNQQIKLFGINCTYIPTKEEAPIMAKQLASLGINCVRFHHIDSTWDDNLLNDSTKPWGKQTTTEIRKELLDRLDYFVFSLKNEGIYVNMNTLVGRKFLKANGLPRGVEALDWKSSHAFTMYNEKGLSLQHEYVKELFTHINPYTGMTYADDPVIAVAEVCNENGIIMSYLCGWMDSYSPNLWNPLEDKWNEWLKQKGYSTEQMINLFNKSEEIGQSLVTDESSWNLEQYEGAVGKVTQKGKKYILNLKKPGKENWHFQFSTSKLLVKPDQMYTISFKAKSSMKAKISVFITMAHDPWQNLGYSQNFEVSQTQKKYKYTFSTIKQMDDNARLLFGNMGLLNGTIELSDIEFYEGGDQAYVKENKQKTGIEFPNFSVYKNLPLDYQKFIMNFLYDLEDQYWTKSRNYFKNDVGYKGLLMGTISGCAPDGLMANFDIIDTHAYFNHPVFTEGDWDVNHYFVMNTDLTKMEDGGTLNSLALHRIYGKPFSVSEYDHPYPNQYSSQDLPMLASYASFQDWDCLYLFSTGKEMLSPDNKIVSYFDQLNNPAKEAAIPIASKIFCQKLVQPAQESVYVDFTRELEKENLTNFTGWNVGNPELFGLNKLLAFSHKIGLVLNNLNDDSNYILQDDFTENLKTPNNSYISDTQEIIRNTKDGVYLVQTPNVYISISTPDKNIEAVNQELSFTHTNDFGVIMAVKEENKYLIFSCSWSGNSNQNLRPLKESNIKLPKENRNKVRVIREPIQVTTDSSYGNGPALALNADGILKITDFNDSSLKGKNVRLFILDSKGCKTKEVKKQANNEFNISSADKTLWYELTWD